MLAGDLTCANVPTTVTAQAVTLRDLPDGDQLAAMTP
jgi:hypothetical protein